MTLSAATLLSGAAIVLAFFPRVPAVLVSFAAFLTAALSGLVAFTGEQLWFWGAASVIAAAIGLMTYTRDGRTARMYIVGGALAGSLVGLVLATVAAVIVSSAAGAFLGLMAFSRTPGGRVSGIGAANAGFLASAGLPAVVNFSMVMLIFAQLLQI